MSLRSLTLGLCVIPFLVASPSHAVDVNQCSMVAEGHAKVISFDAQMADSRRVTLKGLLSGPDGEGPFPAIVLLPGGKGLVTPYCYRRVVEQFVSWGLVTLIVASTTARDEHRNHLSQYSFVDQAKHAQGAALALATVQQANPSRIGVWGHSNGGLAVFDIVSSTRGTQDTVFQAAVAASPQCPAKAGQPSAPLLVIIRDKDSEVSVDACVDFAMQWKDVRGFEFLLIPGADHLYWAPGTPAYNEAAAKLAAKRLKAFLTKHSLLTP